VNVEAVDGVADQHHQRAGGLRPGIGFQKRQHGGACCNGTR
jgi:hypothetical protein